MKRTLADLGVSESATVQAVEGSDGLAQRLAELGFTAGQSVDVVRFAPLGDPMQVRLRGFDLALRRREAQRVVVG
jgi:Fe2+ transport system protein FeoA